MAYSWPRRASYFLRRSVLLWLDEHEDKSRWSDDDDQMTIKSGSSVACSQTAGECADQIATHLLDYQILHLCLFQSEDCFSATLLPFWRDVICMPDDISFCPLPSIYMSNSCLSIKNKQINTLYFEDDISSSKLSCVLWHYSKNSEFEQLTTNIYKFY